MCCFFKEISMSAKESGKDCSQGKEPVSNTRKVYIFRLIGRCIVLAVCVLLCIFRPDQFEVLNGFAFFRKPSLLHILWVIWIIDMIFQLVPVRHYISLGSQKLFKSRFKPIRDKINYTALREYVISTTTAAYKVFIIWVVLLAALGLLHYFGLIGNTVLLMISVVFYVCDLICVLIWCPFRLIMKNRCCTTCRIFNWDHLMMLSPMMFAGGFYATTLVLLAIGVWIVWELCVMMYPERFWENTNEALRCSECTDQLCTQYCRKLRK